MKRAAAAGGGEYKKLPVEKKDRLPKGYRLINFIDRADVSPGYEEWVRVGDLFFGIKLVHENIDDDDPDILFFMTTTGIPASEAPAVAQEFWEKQLLTSLKRVARSVQYEKRKERDSE